MASQTTGTNATKMNFVEHKLPKPSDFNIGQSTGKKEDDDINNRESEYEKKFKELT